MSEAFSVDTDALADTVERMAQFSRSAQALLAEIDATVRSLHLSWTGEAAAAHSYAHAQWTHGASLMGDALVRLGRAGVAAQHNYRRASATNASNWA